MPEVFETLRRRANQASSSKKRKNGAPGWGCDSVSDASCVRSAGVAPRNRLRRPFFFRPGQCAVGPKVGQATHIAVFNPDTSARPMYPASVPNQIIFVLRSNTM
jgi:hypothetical protein